MVQVLLEQGVVGLGHGILELLPIRVGLGRQIFGPVPLGAGGAAVVAPCPAGQQVHDPGELVLLADGELDRSHLGAERPDQLLERSFERRPFPVELVDEDGPRQAGLDGHLPHCFGLDLHTVDGGLPSSTRPIRVSAPEANSMASVRVVFPEPL